MNLSHPLASLAPGLEAVVLEVLGGVESGLGTSQITRVAVRGSRSGIQQALDRLVWHGLVLATRSNYGHMYQLNRDHLLAPAVLACLAARRELLERLADEVRALTPRPVHASVFGSFARGTAAAESDVDLLLVMTTEPTATDRWNRQMRTLEDRVLRWTGNRLELIVLTSPQAAAALDEEPVLIAARRDGITLMGVQLDRLGKPAH